MNKVHINMTRTELRRTITACSTRDVAMVLFIFSVWGDSMGMQAGYIRGVSWFCAACALIAAVTSLVLWLSPRSCSEEKSTAEVIRLVSTAVIMLAVCVLSLYFGL